MPSNAVVSDVSLGDAGMFSEKDKARTSSSLTVNQYDYLGDVFPVVMLGCAASSDFSLGLIVGGVTAITTFKIHELMDRAGQLNKLSKESIQDLLKEIDENPLLIVLWLPILEEFIFRGGLQSLLSLSLSYTNPDLESNVVALYAVMLTSLLFGLAHIPNSKNNDNYPQMIRCIFAGLAFGALYEQKGIFPAIAAHIANNTVDYTRYRFGKQSARVPVEETDVVTTVARVTTRDNTP